MALKHPLYILGILEICGYAQHEMVSTKPESTLTIK